MSLERSASYKSNGVSQLIIHSAVLEILSGKDYKNKKNKTKRLSRWRSLVTVLCQGNDHPKVGHSGHFHSSGLNPSGASFTNVGRQSQLKIFERLSRWRSPRRVLCQGNDHPKVGHFGHFHSSGLNPSGASFTNVGRQSQLKIFKRLGRWRTPQGLVSGPWPPQSWLFRSFSLIRVKPLRGLLHRRRTTKST